MSNYLSKSDFKLARTCPTKLYYKKKGYPSALDEDQYLKLLAKGGYMIEAIVHQIYPNAVHVSHDKGNQAAIDETQRLLAEGHTELFEPTFVSNGKLVRVDCFRMIGDTIELIEVKAKSWDSTAEPRPTMNKKGTALITKWEPYIADVAFQKLVLEEIYPDHTVIPYLMMPDQAKTTTIDLLHQHFEVVEHTRPGSSFTNYAVRFTGDADELRGNHFMTRVNVEDEIALFDSQISDETEMLLDVLLPELSLASSPLTSKCKSCEYRTSEYDASGFAQCWGEYGNPEHSIFDLYYGTQLQNQTGNLYDQMIVEGKTSLLDLDESQLVTKSGSVGARNVRQLMQLTNTRNGSEWQDDELNRKMERLEYPLHFIDFETSSLAIPYHEGMRPYEVVAFQWSCHTMQEPGGTVTHEEWINTEDVFPNFGFAKSLSEHLGSKGSVLIWSPHEKTILRHINAQMKKNYFTDAALTAWLDETQLAGGLIDMNKWCHDHYFHPLMKGRTSIKNVCDAVWQNNESVRTEFSEYASVDSAGNSVSPYAGLKPVVVHGKEMDISVGTDAVTAYQSLLYGLDRGDTQACDAIKNGLLTYCKLDTAAMVMIWRHWGAEGA